jgi:hypothetical protein
MDISLKSGIHLLHLTCMWNIFYCTNIVLQLFCCYLSSILKMNLRENKNCNLTLGYFAFNSSIFISIYHLHAQSLIQSTRKRHSQGHETESRVTSVSGNVLDQLNISLRSFNYGHITEKWNSSSTSNLRPQNASWVTIRTTIHVLL